jgi:hypothetical protein
MLIIIENSPRAFIMNMHYMFGYQYQADEDTDPHLDRRRWWCWRTFILMLLIMLEFSIQEFHEKYTTDRYFWSLLRFENN